MLGPSPMHIKYVSYVYLTEFAYDGPIFLVPLSLPYASSPVLPILNGKKLFFYHLKCIKTDLLPGCPHTEEVR